MENNEWPDAERLKELRAEGIFPYSILTVECVTGLVFLAVTYFQFSNFEKMFVLFRKMLAEPLTNISAVKLHAYELLSLTGTVFIIYALSFAVSFLLTVLMQSKFYFSLVNLSFNLAQILKVKNVSIAFFLITIVKGAVGMFLGLTMGCALFYWVSREFLTIMFSDPLFGMKGLEAVQLLPVIKSLLILSVFLMAVVAATSYFFVRLNFMNKHRNKR